MNFFQFLKSLDDLLFEIISWLVFYPVTLWRSFRHPLAMADYAADELKRPDDEQFDEALSPPILILLTVLVGHGLELSLIGQSTLIADRHGLAALISDDTSLILLRLVAFATFPLIFAVHTIRKQRAGLTRQSLEAPFFAQCYINAPFALLVSFAATLFQMHGDGGKLTALALFLFSAIGFVAVETMWFRKALNAGFFKAFLNAITAYAEAILFMFMLGWLVGGTAV